MTTPATIHVTRPTPHTSTEIPAAERGSAVPATHTQVERLLWGRHVHQVNNNIALGLRFDGPLDVPLLERSLQRLSERHESLRTVFPEADPESAEQHVMLLLPPRPLPLPVIEAPDEPEESRLRRVLALLAEHANQPFDLAAGPLFRPVLGRVSDTLHVLSMTTDHVVFDAWSARIMINDLLTLYATAQGDDVPPLPELPVQFPDFALWQHGHLTGQQLDRQLGYWRRQLDGITPIPSSGLADPAPPTGAEPGVTKLLEPLDADLSQEIEALALRERTTSAVVIAAALKAAMWRLRRETLGDAEAGDVATFGSLANRTRPEIDDMVGYVATPATFRTRFTSRTTFRHLVRQEAQTLFHAMRHQRVPFSLILRELAPEQYGVRFRKPGDVPIYLNFDMDMVEDAREPLLCPAGLDVQPVGIPMPEVPRGGLRVIGYRRKDDIAVELRYRHDLYSHTWAAAFLASVRTFLARGTAQADDTIEDLA
ncbi:condensation domain-containing protein [Streptomyces sp. NPDC012825]|uniref:condensation domain-containing protein n=1 Tax=Streptomyces sp. NPDC012825 TaxID=3364851 RepID=UPI003689F8F5